MIMQADSFSFAIHGNIHHGLCFVLYSRNITYQEDLILQACVIYYQRKLYLYGFPGYMMRLTQQEYFQHLNFPIFEEFQKIKKNIL